MCFRHFKSPKEGINNLRKPRQAEALGEMRTRDEMHQSSHAEQHCTEGQIIHTKAKL